MRWLCLLMLWLLLPLWSASGWNAVIDTAKQYVGVREVGKNRGYWIDEWNRWARVPLGSPYCASFVGWVLWRAGYWSVIGYQRTGHALTLLRLADARWRYPAALAPRLPDGQILVWRWGETTRGHAGIQWRKDEARAWTVEGNTTCWGQAVGAAAEREGDGVCVKRRTWRELLHPGRVFRVVGVVLLPR
jgi:hypothetical protein